MNESSSPGPQRRCFVCKEMLGERHGFYPGLCPPCGDVSHAKRLQTADLSGRVALVTGARVGIGYVVALRLLRAGATVLAATRFPHDAARRYAGEADFDAWGHRLQVHCLDLKHVAGVEQFTAHLSASCDRLDILVNNAAQTVRRPPGFYQHLLAFESLPVGELPPALRPLIAAPPRPVSYAAVPARGVPPLLPEPAYAPSERNHLAAAGAAVGPAFSDEAMFPPGCLTEDGQQVDLRPHNSWRMKDDEVSALELLEVHVVNAVAPFLLCSRLKALMARGDDGAYIVNVTSMEGQFGTGDKSSRHPHTNMAKAALNMLTRTCAQEYARHRIYMNSVDPGWVSFQHPHPQQETLRAQGVTPPFDMADAAARVCDPVFTGVAEGQNRWGKLFKDYRQIDW